MRIKGIVILLLIIWSFQTLVHAQQFKAEVFLANLVSKSDTKEFSSTITPDGNEFYFARLVAENKYSIFVTKKENGKWTEPVIASFSGDYFNHEPYITVDGKRIYWGSERPLNGGETKYSMWTARREGNEWIDTKPVPFNAMYITSTVDGVLYYTGRGKGGAVIAKAWQDDSGQWQTETLPEPILADYWDGHPLIAPDESWLIFDSENRPGTRECGLFISVKQEDGSWSQPVNMVDTLGMGRYAMLSPDGKTLFFSWKGDIYHVSAEVLDSYLRK